jgi:hypothetical protein
MRLPITTAHHWLAKARRRFRPVLITPAPAVANPAGLVLCTRRGHRLEGLDVVTAVAVLRALEADA